MNRHPSNPGVPQEEDFAAIATCTVLSSQQRRADQPGSVHYDAVYLTFADCVLWRMLHSLCKLPDLTPLQRQ